MKTVRFVNTTIVFSENLFLVFYPFHVYSFHICMTQSYRWFDCVIPSVWFFHGFSMVTMLTYLLLVQNCHHVKRFSNSNKVNILFCTENNLN